MIYTKCPNCGATLSVPEEYKDDRLLHCSQCNQNFDNDKNFLWEAPEEKPKAAPKQDTQTRWTKQQKRGLWVLAFCVCIALYYCGAFDSTGTPQIGDRVVVVNTTWGTLDKDNDELGDAMVARDAVGIYEQTSSGKAKHIWQGSHGKVIHGSWTKVQVRFDDGTLYWIPTEAVKKE